MEASLLMQTAYTINRFRNERLNELINRFRVQFVPLPVRFS